MKKFVYLFVLILIVTGCNTSNESYQGLLVYQGDTFVLQGDDLNNEYTIDKRIGTIERKVKPSVMPQENLWSNYLEKGTELFRSKEDRSVILVKRNEQIEVFFLNQ